MLVVLIVGPRRRGEAVVEEAQSAAGNVRDHAVKNFAAALVGVESVPEKMPLAAAALRGAKANRTPHDWLAAVGLKRILLFAAEFQCRDDVADPGQTAALDQRPFGFVHHFINPARLE